MNRDTPLVQARALVAELVAASAAGQESTPRAAELAATLARRLAVAPPSPAKPAREPS